MVRTITVLLTLLLALPAFAAQRSGLPGAFDYYLLALSWSPEFCATRGEDAAQCHTGPHYGFVVHGLWPQYNDGSYPTACRPPSQVPERLVGRVLPIMPDKALIQHEWVQHGDCSGLSMDDYFDAIGHAYRKVQIPLALQAPHQRVRASVERIKQMLAEANPGLTAPMVAVLCAGRNRAVREVHVCLDKSLNFRPCGAEVLDTCRGGQGELLPVK